MSDETVTYWQPVEPCNITTTTERTVPTEPRYPNRDGASFEQCSDGWVVEVTHEYRSPTMSPIDHAVMLEALSPDASYADFDAALPDGVDHEDVFPHVPEHVTVRLKYEYSPYTGTRQDVDGHLAIYRYGEREYTFNGEQRTSREWVPYYDEDDEYGEELPVKDGQIVERELVANGGDGDDYKWVNRLHPLWGDRSLQSFAYAHAMGEVPDARTPVELIRDAVVADKGPADTDLRVLLDTEFDPEAYRTRQRGDDTMKGGETVDA